MRALFYKDKSFEMFLESEQELKRLIEGELIGSGIRDYSGNDLEKRSHSN